jgi:hypothetical protein
VILMVARYGVGGGAFGVADARNDGCLFGGPSFCRVRPRVKLAAAGEQQVRRPHSSGILTEKADPHKHGG